MRDSKYFAPMVLAAALLAASAGVAHAESPPPFGFWATPDGGEQLLVTQGGQCSLANGFSGQITTSGSCTWTATSDGGILMIMSDQQFQPAPVRFNVIWVNNTTISVNGDPFYLQQQ
jgi:hypothetical protein